MTTLLVKDGTLGDHPTLLMNGGQFACECCGEIPSVPDCESYPLGWLATISGMLADPNGHIHNVNPGVADPSGRVWCDNGASQRYHRYDFTPSDGTYALPYISTSLGTRTWSLANVIDYERWSTASTGGVSIASDGLFDDTVLAITIVGCIEGPGDVTISATYSFTTGSPTHNFTGIFAWNKTITLAAGQKLKDLTSISLDPVTDNYALPSYAGASYVYNAFTCTHASGDAMTAHPSALTLVPQP